MYINSDQSYFERPQELIDLVNTTKLVQKYLPRQMNIDRILDIIKRKVLKGTHLPFTIKEIQVRLFNQSLFQGHIQIFGLKYLAKEKACKTKGRKLIRKIYPIGFFAI